MVFAGNGVSDIVSALLLPGPRPTATVGIADLAHSRIGGDASTLALLLAEDRKLGDHRGWS